MHDVEIVGQCVTMGVGGRRPFNIYLCRLEVWPRFSIAAP